MKTKFTLLLFTLLLLGVRGSFAEVPSEARWIASAEKANGEPNTWIAFRRDIQLKKQPRRAIVRVAADTKYWLWVNGELAVFEGGLKRGPNRTDTYCDSIDLAPYLKKGGNKIAILLWHFGKDGFSHKNSGKAGLFVSAGDGDFELVSDSRWLCRVHPAFGDTGKPHPNYRLAESNIRFDATLDIEGWQTAGIEQLAGFSAAVELGGEGDAPWGDLVGRPIPQWKDFGIKEAAFEVRPGATTDSIVARLPYNMQITPVITLDDPAGHNTVGITTDHSFAGGTPNVRAEYVTKKGQQTYESLGWMNGQKIILTVPKGVSVKHIAYRETGYDAHPEGTFACDDDFYNLFWEKALRTLYVNMRDNYFDCPDRERAQWWGDVVVLMGESFYSYSTSAHALMRKAILELAAWQRPDGVLFSPIPAGGQRAELPGQMLASVGRYGFWNYYMNTGDEETICAVYPAVRKYLSLWETDETGLTSFRAGNWTWGDWGDNRDIRLIFAGWHYMALEGAANMADMLGYPEDAAGYRAIMERVRGGYNKCWNGTAYRHPEYRDDTDDRVQALAVIAGIAGEDKYPRISELLRTQFHASPYMEKYVMEALFVMGDGDYAMERTRERFGPMVNNTDYTTLFEGWGIGKEGFGGGTTNHAWSGGALTVIARYLFGISPLEPGYGVFAIEPDPVLFGTASITVPTVKGTVGVDFTSDDNALTVNVTVTAGTTAVLALPGEPGGNVTVNGKSPSKKQLAVPERYNMTGKTALVLKSGTYTIVKTVGK